MTFVASPQACLTASLVAIAVVASPAGAVAVAALASNDEASAFSNFAVRIRPLTSHDPAASILQKK